jgi:hypothetical protein
MKHPIFGKWVWTVFPELISEGRQILLPQSADTGTLPSVLLGEKEKKIPVTYLLAQEESLVTISILPIEDRCL